MYANNGLTYNVFARINDVDIIITSSSAASLIALPADVGSRTNACAPSRTYHQGMMDINLIAKIVCMRKTTGLIKTDVVRETGFLGVSGEIAKG